MLAKHIVVIGPDAAIWCQRLNGIAGLRACERANSDDSAGPAGSTWNDVDMVMVTQADRLREVCGDQPLPRPPVILVGVRAEGIEADAVVSAAEWPSWAPVLVEIADAVLVRSALLQLDELGGTAFVTELTDILLAQTPQQLDEIDESLSAGLAGVAQRIGHTMKSSFGSFGARRCQRLAAKLEAAARSDRLDDCRPIAGQLRLAFADFCEILKAGRPGPDHVVVERSARP